MVQAPSFTDVVHELVIHSEVAVEEARKNENYVSGKDPLEILDTNTIERLYEHADYLVERFRFLLDRQITPDFPNNQMMLARARYAMYRELCDYGLKDVAGKIREDHRGLSK